MLHPVCDEQSGDVFCPSQLMSLDVDDIFTGLPQLVGGTAWKPDAASVCDSGTGTAETAAGLPQDTLLRAGHSRVLMKELVRVDQRGSHDSVFANVDDDSGDGSGG